MIQNCLPHIELEFHDENVFLHWENNFFGIKKVLLIQKKFLWSKEIDFFTSKKMFLNQQNFLQLKKKFSLTVYQRNRCLCVKADRALSKLNFFFHLK